MTKIYSHERYNKLVEATVHQLKELSRLKGGEYAGDTDRLANFRRNAEALGLKQEQVWSVYAAKHWDAIMQYVKDVGAGKERERLESITGRADDLIVYLVLFKAIFEDGTQPTNGLTEQKYEGRSDWARNKLAHQAYSNYKQEYINKC